jgi:nicotinate-nucleotide adenylyltransferase
MLRQMLAGTPYEIEEVEIEREDGPSFTAATLELLSKREPESRWILIMGSDQAANFPQWRSAGKILGMSSIAVAQRPWRMGRPEATLPNVLKARQSESWSGAPGEAILLPSTDLELSSSAIKAHLAKGEEPDGLPTSVKTVIVQNGIYQ